MDGGVAQTILSNVGQLVGEEFRQLHGVGGEVARLRDELATMNALLRMESEAEEGAVDHFVREWMKQLREVAYDAEDCVDLYLFRVRSRSGDRFFVLCKRFLVTLVLRRRLACDIRALRAQAADINEQHARYGFCLEPLRRRRSLASVAASAHALRPADDPNQLVGIREQAAPLVGRMRPAAAGDTDTKLKVFSVVGFGGLGKTTLAMEVCRQLEADFQRQAQVSVSQAFDLGGLLKRVLEQIVEVKADRQVNSNDDRADPLGCIDDMETDELGDKLTETLMNKRYLIMIDDIWTVAAWEVIKSKLPDHNCSSRIIVTTRIDTVAKACCSGSANDYYIHHIEPLNEENSRKLFLSRAFGSIDASCPKDLEDVMKKVLKKCGGLPLAIVSIASILASYKSPESKHMWETIFKSIGSQMESHPSLEGMRQIITLSYDHLPHHLKGCMMYFSIFPEDYVVVKYRLLRRWIAEGLVAEKRGLTLMDVAESYFNELVISRSMIDRAADIVTFYDGREEMCRVHDMMLEVMVSKSLDANFISLIGGQYEGMLYDRVRRLSVHGAVEECNESSSKKMAAWRGKGNDIKGMNVQHVRSLSMFELEGHKLLNQLGEFTLLRVLDLEDCKSLGKKHMGYICRMYLLRFLNLKGTDISVLPPEVGELEHLQTLDVRFTCLKDLPKSVTELEKLESLQFSNKHDNDIRWMPPLGLKKMKALRKVNKVVIRSNIEVAQEIGELEELQELGIYVDSTGPIHQEVHEELNRSLSKLYSLRCLNIGDIGFDRGVMNFLHGLTSPPRLLRYLRMCGGLVGRGLPEWVGLLTSLVEFVIAWAYLRGDTLFNVLCKLPNLKTLTLESNFYADTEIVARTSQSFPVLTELRLYNNHGIPAVYRFEKGSLPKLETLALKFYVGEQNIVGIEHLTNLKEVQFTGEKGNKAMEDELEKLKKENGRRKREGASQLTVKVRYE